MEQLEDIQLKEGEKSGSTDNETAEAFASLERGVYAALETYSNVHRGSGHNSMVSTYLFEQARDIVLEYLKLDKDRYVVIFCSSRRETALISQIKSKNYQSVSSQDFGLSLGVRALAVNRKALPHGAPFQTGGGTTRLISPERVIWANAPDKFEAGTPAIVNIIAFARALKLIQQYGKEIFLNAATEELKTADLLYHDELEKYSGKELLDKLRQTLIGRSFMVPTNEGSRPYINLDNSASTPSFIPIWNVVRQTWHQSKQVQIEIVQEVRAICAGALGASLDNYDVIFTSNATEAINLAAESMSRKSEEGVEPVVLNTLLEHSSNDLPWRMVPGLSLVRMQVDAEGFIDLNELDALLSSYNQNGEHGKKRIRLVAVSGASNVLGICNNLGEISRIAHQYNARLLVDAAQMVAHRKVGMDLWNIDYLAFSAHKVYAPFGTGVLVVRKGLLNFSTTEMESIQSSGDENAGGIAALGKALIFLQKTGMELIQDEEQGLTARALHGMAKIAGLRIYGIKDPYSPVFSSKIGVIVFSMKGIFPNKVAKELANRGGIGIRYGCHCAHILVKHILNVPPSLQRFQYFLLTLFQKIRLPGVARVSFGIENSEEDVDILLNVLGDMASKPSIPKTDIEQRMNDFIRAAAQRVYT